jgi:hypothetical protein
MAQLPYLVYEQKPPMSSVEFLDLARSLLNRNDASLVECLSLDPKADTGIKFIDNWYDWERDLRLYLAKQRMIKLKRENLNVAEPSAFHLEASATASKAIDENSPLEGEIIIDKARWNAIESFIGNDYFDRSNVFAYYLKLLLLERRQLFDVEKGFAEYKSLYTYCVQNAGDPK